MFCHKCGTQIAEGAGFCHKCGTKTAASAAVQQTSGAAAPAAGTVAAPPRTPAASVQTVGHSPGVDAGFREFVDNHVRATTKFQSAEDLLKNGKPSLRFAWICIGIPAVLGLFFGLRAVLASAMPAYSVALSVLLFTLFGYMIAVPVGFFVRSNSANPYSGHFKVDIDNDDLLLFLNGHLSYLSPYMHGWRYYVEPGRVVVGLDNIILTSATTAIGNSIQTRRKEVTLCADYETNQKRVVTFTTMLDLANPDSGEKTYFFAAKNFDNNPFKLDVCFSKNACLFKTAPILQAAMEYYLKERNEIAGQ